MKDRRAMITTHSDLSQRRQCEMLKVSRATLHYHATPIDAEDLALMRRIDELHLRFPFYGSRKIMHVLRREGTEVNRKRVQRLMRIMNLEGQVPRRDTSKPNVLHERFPYLLRNLRIARPNQVWAADITYIPMAVGFLYLVAIIDWFSRRVLAWQLSNTLDTGFCVEALQRALGDFGNPEIFNTDQGAQFTASDFTSELLSRGIKVSMDGKGRFIDNIFVERFWRSLKYEEVYLYAYAAAHEAQAGIGRYTQDYNFERPHQSLGYQTPDAFYRDAIHRAA